jgi:peptidyl-tRNA hydrolase, PTH1 family
MPFLQKKPNVNSVTPLYTLGANKNLLIVGLGNIGKQYDGTRHNIGFACLDAFAATRDFPGWVDKKDLKCQMTSSNLGETRVMLLKPTTMMNLSGEAVQAAAHFYKISHDQIAVVHDELDISFGQIRTRIGGSDAGHNGVKSIIQLLGEDFGRVRIGIGPKTPEQIDSADFVLMPFNDKEVDQLSALTREVSAILSEYAFSNQPLPAETRSFIV